MWLGSIQNSDENRIGTPRGVLKSRSKAPLPESQQFDSEVIDVLGTAWKPATRHLGSKVRMSISEKDGDDEGHVDIEELDARIDDEDEVRKEAVQLLHLRTGRVQVQPVGHLPGL